MTPATPTAPLDPALAAAARAQGISTDMLLHEAWEAGGARAVLDRFTRAPEAEATLAG